MLNTELILSTTNSFDTHYSIANMLMSTYQFRFKCASFQKLLWYEFKNHHWIKIDEYYLKKIIMEDLRQYFPDQVPKNNVWIHGVIRECANIAFDPNFLKELDENKNLICFTNGVYDLKTGILRDGQPSDYISLCTNDVYVKFDPTDERVIQIDDFLNKIQPNREMKDYLLRLLSTCLTGYIRQESFYVWIGDRSNGKNKLMELLGHTLGDYFKLMDPQLLTTKRFDSVLDAKGIRACIFNDINSTNKLNSSFIKSLMGGDQFICSFFNNHIPYYSQNKLFILCDSLPKIEFTDEGIWRRIKVIPFESHFIDPVDLSKEQTETEFTDEGIWRRIKVIPFESHFIDPVDLSKEQTETEFTDEGIWRRIKVIPFESHFIDPVDLSKEQTESELPSNYFLTDYDLSEKFAEWKPVFMSMLLEYYKDYLQYGLVCPKIVIESTRTYRNKCNPYHDFITEYLNKTDNDSDIVSIKDFYILMKQWHKNNYDGKCPTMKDFRHYLEIGFDNYDKKNDILFGYKISVSNI